MSIIVTTPAKIATLSAATRKAFTSVPLDQIVHGVIFREGVGPETGIRPSDLRMTTASALTALGGRMTPQSFVHGLTFAAARFAHGNQIDAAGLPAGSLTAINATLELIKKGAGISALSLETAVLKGIDALLALPAPVKKPTSAEKPAIDAPTVDAPTVDAPTVDAPHWSTFTGAINPDADSAIAESAANAAIDAAAAEAAAAEAVAAEAAEYRKAKAAEFVTDAKASANSICCAILKRADSEQIARQLALTLGFKLVRTPVKKAA